MKQALTCPEIFINEICFCEEDKIHLFGFVCSGNDFLPAQIISNRSALKLLLRDNGKIGREILLLIATLLHLPHAAPMSIDLIGRFGTTQAFRSNTVILWPMHSNFIHETTNCSSSVWRLFLEESSTSAKNTHI